MTNQATSDNQIVFALFCDDFPMIISRNAAVQLINGDIKKFKRVFVNNREISELIKFFNEAVVTETCHLVPFHHGISV